MQNSHVVDEAHIALEHGGAQLQLPRDVVDGIYGLCLGFGQARDAGCTGRQRRAADEKTSGEVPDDLVVMVVEDSPAVIGGIAAMAVDGMVRAAFSSGGRSEIRRGKRGTREMRTLGVALRVKRPVWLGEHADQVRASGSQHVVDGETGGEYALAALLGAVLGNEAEAVANRVGVERLHIALAFCVT